MSPASPIGPMTTRLVARVIRPEIVSAAPSMSGLSTRSPGRPASSAEARTSAGRNTPTHRHLGAADQTSSDTPGAELVGAPAALGDVAPSEVVVV